MKLTYDSCFQLLLMSVALTVKYICSTVALVSEPSVPLVSVCHFSVLEGIVWALVWALVFF